MTQQRFRVWFRKGERVRYISHLDVLRFWERAIRRAELPLSYSQGFTPHPKIAFAGPLPLGFVGEAELMDVTLDERVAVDEFRRRLEEEATEDLAVVRVQEVAPSAPSPQASVAWADYRVNLPDVSPGAARDVVSGFLAKRELTWTEEKKEKTRTYNLRDVVASLTVTPSEAGTTLSMRLRADQEMTGRPEQVLAAVFPGVEHGVIARTSILLDEPSPARDLWRRRGQYQ
ncbi:MAG TPA: TIGR03936 family radical SAM-associated protein [Tepidiformaceae bacterium]|nr:TIGR03936 family radical SAM-associated protein [Tepidiformaceae bacterium]